MFKTTPSEIDTIKALALEKLQQGSQTTEDFRMAGIFSAAAVVKSLRNDGYYIITTREGMMAKYTYLKARKMQLVKEA